MFTEAFLFPPAANPYIGTDWAEGVLGELIRPVLNSCSQGKPAYYWFNRYTFQTIDGDAQKAGVDETFRTDAAGNKQQIRQLKFFFSTDPAFEAAVKAEATKLGIRCDFRPSTFHSELIGNRFVGDNSQESPNTRADLVAALLRASADVVLSMLIKSNGNWKLEASSHHDNCGRSPLVSAMHMACNAAGFSAPLQNFVWHDGRPDTMHYYHATHYQHMNLGQMTGTIFWREL